MRQKLLLNKKSICTPIAFILLCLSQMTYSQNEAFDRLPWLETVIAENNCCDNTTVLEYNQGVHSFIYIKPDYICGEFEKGRLYTSFGQFYCQDSDGYSCTQVYGLSDSQSEIIWQCGDEPEPPQPPDFSNFPWLTNLVDVGNCCNNSIIREYDMGVYSFIYIKPDKDCSESEEGRLYINTGQFYCSDSENYDCIEAFGLETREYNTIWQCSDDNPEAPEEPEEPENSPPSFPNMPWLLDLLDPTDCCDASSITEFDFGVYSFIYIAPEDGCGQNNFGKLYINTGQFYCSDSENYSCLDAYQLSFSAGKRIWNCSGDGSRLISQVDQIELQAFPNPSTGIFNLDLSVNTNQDQFVSVYNIAGRELQNFVVPANSSNSDLQLDLSEYSNGVYLLKLNTFNSTFTQKLILNK